MMLIKIPLLILFFLVTAFLAFAQPDLELKFRQPATHFTEASPLGNGRLGVMVFGDPGKERMVLNEISMWSGGIENPNRTNAHEYLKPIQALLLAGKNKEAQQLLQQQFVCAGKGSGFGNGANVKFGCYQTLGDLEIQWKDSSIPFQDYQRILRIDSAVNTTSWRKNGIHFREQVLVSAPAQAIIVRLTASEKAGLNFLVSLSRKERSSISAKGTSMILSGTLNGGEDEKGIDYAAALAVIPVDGKQSIQGDKIEISGATECLLIITAGTNLNWPAVETRGPDPLVKALKQNNDCARRPWQQLLQSHVRDYQSYFNKCRIWLNDPDASTTSLQDRLQALQQGNEDPSLISLYFNYGRYLLISSSRPGGMPANLQGLWAEEYQTPWNGDYHIDINLQMNYWLADPTNLSACQEPLYQLLQQMSHYGQATAKEYYNAKGWVAHVIYNPWGFTAPGEGADWGSTMTGGAWLATQLLEHYQFYPDKKFLRLYYPVLKGAAAFFKNILIPEAKHQWLVTAPSNSPENSFKLPNGDTASTCMGPTIDMQIGRQLLLGTAHAAKILGVDGVWADSLMRIAKALAPNQISPKTGAIQEWLEDYEETDPRHRHVSPLYALHPYDEITPWDAPQLAAAARQTLGRRGDEGTGWSRAWKIAFWARLGDGDHAYKMLKALLSPVGASSEIKMSSGAGTYANLFDAHPPFQIDGNFGATAAIAEFFLQSHGKDQMIRLLPALPRAPGFQTGKLKGLRARNGFELDFSWQEGKITEIQIHSFYGLPCKIVTTAELTVRDSLGNKIPATFRSNILQFNTRAGGKYYLISGSGQNTFSNPGEKGLHAESGRNDSLKTWSPTLNSLSTNDWLVRKTNIKAAVYLSRDKKNMILYNGLVRRSFLLSPNIACTGYRNMSNGQELLRALRPEARITINGSNYAVGGLYGQTEHAYLLTSSIPDLRAGTKDFQFVSYTVEPIRPLLQWKSSHWTLNQKPATGKLLSFRYQSPLAALKGIFVKVNYELYDGLPLIVKWVAVENKSGKTITIGTLVNESLALVEEESAVVGSPEQMKKQHGIYVETNYAFNNAMRYDISDQTTHWKTDSVYTSQVNYNYQTPCLLEVYPEKVTAVELAGGASFNSVRTHELLMDSYDRERRGLAIRKMYYTIAPWTTANPIFMHLVSKTDQEVTNAVDQCRTTGYEAMILSFGSHCDMEDTSAANIRKWKKLADYAHANGILIGSYSLFSSRRISDEDDVIDPLTHKPGGAFFGNAPCYGSKWGLAYLEKLKYFIKQTGFNLFENDGPYPGDLCASTVHPGHKNLDDSQWRQMELQKSLYHWCNENGVYVNAPDWYFLDGTNKIAIGYREVNFSLPRENQMILNRQNIYDGLWEKSPSMSWGFVPLTRYQGGGPEAVLEPLDEHLKDYTQLMMQYYGAGVQACYRGPRLYDTERTRQQVTSVIGWYKKYREILNADIIHLRRADGQDWDGIMHVNPQLKTRALVMLYNPLKEKIERTISLPLYYAGLTTAASVRERDGKALVYPLNRQYEIQLKVSLPAAGYTWFIIE